MRFFKSLSLFFFLLTAFSACKKNSSSFDTTPNFYIINGGVASFDKNLILFGASDTVTINLIISSTYTVPVETTLNFEVADNYRELYNTNNGTAYKAMPATAYSFQPTITAAKGSYLDTLPVTIYKQYLLSDNFMLPVIIKSASNYKIDSSSSVIYLYTKSNTLSGIYNSKVSKMIYTGDADEKNLVSTDTSTLIKGLIPATDTISELSYADLGSNGWKYELQYTAATGFMVSPNKIIEASIQPGSFTVLASSFNPATKDIYLKTSYKNSNGDARIVEESLTLYR